MPRLALRPRLVASVIVCMLAAGAGPVLAQDAGPAPQNDELNATLWEQQSIEYKANAQAVYDLARIRLDQALADGTWTALPDLQQPGYVNQPTAIITDLDETMLDNNVYEASLITRGVDYSGKDWSDYVEDEVARAVPGAVAFANYAAAKGVTIFYVSNRESGNDASTAANLKKLGFPMGGNVDTLLTEHKQPDWKSDKGSRFATVAKDYRVLLMLGDNMGDFTDDYKGSPAERLKVYQADLRHWGHDWLMIANPEYGSFETAPFGGDYSLSASKRRQMKIDSLDAWSPSADTAAPAN